MTENPYIDLVSQAFDERGMVRTKFSGCSMLPTLSEGMFLAIERSDPRSVKAADIIFYKRGGQMVVHRVVKVLRKGGKIIFATKGDNQAYIDCDHVPEGDLLGVVRGAFFGSATQANVLIDNRFIGLMYALMGSSVMAVMSSRKYIPHRARGVLKYVVGGFFFVFKKSIHTLYLGMRNGQLFIRRRCSSFPGA